MWSTLLQGHDLTIYNMGIGYMKIYEIASIVSMAHMVARLPYLVIYGICCFCKVVIQVQVCPNALQRRRAMMFVHHVIKVEARAGRVTEPLPEPAMSHQEHRRWILNLILVELDVDDDHKHGLGYARS